MTGVDGPAPGILSHVVAELPEERDQLGEAAVHVADGVERAGLVAEIVEERLAHDRSGVDLVDPVQHVYAPEPLFSEELQRPPELVVLAPDDGGREVAVAPLGVARDTRALGHVENDGDRQHVVGAGELDERLPRLRLDVRGVDHRQQARLEPLGGHVSKGLERGGRGLLVVLVVRDETSEVVARQRLERLEGARREGRLAGARRADQHDERHAGNSELCHRQILRKSASWVGEPCTSSTSPTVRCSTV